MTTTGEEEKDKAGEVVKEDGPWKRQERLLKERLQKIAIARQEKNNEMAEKIKEILEGGENDC